VLDVELGAAGGPDPGAVADAVVGEDAFDRDAWAANQATARSKNATQFTVFSTPANSL
jgi:hypothetical protein